VAAPDDPFSMLELLIGLPNVRVLSVDRVDEDDYPAIWAAILKAGGPI
jgi:hypothetical protein